MFFCKFRILRKLLIIFFLFGFLYSNTELFQVFRVYNLVSHYLDFKQVDNSLSSFLYCHYFGSDNDSSDNNIDSKLPFKSSFLLKKNDVVPIFTLINLVNYFYIVILVFISYYKINWVFSNFHPSIWQPPKNLIVI